MSDRQDDVTAGSQAVDPQPPSSIDAVRPRFLPLPFVVLLLAGALVTFGGLVGVIVGEGISEKALGAFVLALGLTYFVAAWQFFLDHKLGYVLALVLVPLVAVGIVWDHVQFGSPDSGFPWFGVAFVAVAWLLLVRPSVVRFFRHR